mmetsp:Transcript_42901/g.128182  ORF Transcript_42901/g.128182 Transcript_42901/m.128182 type:complete len:243 (-) Transcript_42901:25-753(-)
MSPLFMETFVRSLGFHASSSQTLFSRQSWLGAGSPVPSQCCRSCQSRNSAVLYIMGMGPCAHALSKEPTRSVRRPFSVMLRCSKDVMPSLCERVGVRVPPHQTCASMAPRKPRSRKTWPIVSTSQMRLASCAESNTRSFSRSSSARMVFQTSMFTSRKASRKAKSLGGACLMEMSSPKRGTKTSFFGPHFCTECQSAFNNCSLPLAPTSKPQAPQRPPGMVPRDSGHGSTMPLNGPWGSSRK